MTYYGDDGEQAEETADHAAWYWAMDWGRGTGGMIERVRAARAVGFGTIVLDVEAVYHGGEAALRERFAAFQASGLLAGASVILFPIDEPDVNNVPVARVFEVNALIRRVAADYPAFASARIIGTWNCGGDFRGIQAHDIVSCDHYDAREGIFTNGMYATMKSLAPDKEIAIIAGGCCQWRQDPRPFVDLAMRDPQVIAIIGFVWFDRPGLPGIRSNGLAGLYRSEAAFLKGP
jgi:hypothetical protein